MASARAAAVACESAGSQAGAFFTTACPFAGSGSLHSWIARESSGLESRGGGISRAQSGGAYLPAGQLFSAPSSRPISSPSTRLVWQAGAFVCRQVCAFSSVATSAESGCVSCLARSSAQLAKERDSSQVVIAASVARSIMGPSSSTSPVFPPTRGVAQSVVAARV